MAIEIICIRGAGDKEMGEIEDSLINTDFMAVKRGTYEIDKQWYLIHSLELDVPLRETDEGEALMDDDIVHVSDSVLGLSGKRRIRGISLSGTATDVSCQLTLEKFEEFV